MKEIPPWEYACRRGRRWRWADPIKAFGKPLETMGQQSYGTKVRRKPGIRAMFAGLQFGKPRETVGRQSKGPKE